ncbi:IS3 family transposase [Chryseobacterium suipulveris]|uniref:IS3 family transposase n=1 Tax=Chryseobacterium suipulveris TaxID=2929800 RepID=UPI0037BE3C5C
MVDKNYELSVRRQCDLLCISRSSLYYSPKKESGYNLEIMRQIDEIQVKCPSFGIRRIINELKELGITVNRKRVCRPMKTMGIATIYPKRNLSKLGLAKYIRPYLLRNMKITVSNQVWQAI